MTSFLSAKLRTALEAHGVVQSGRERVSRDDLAVLIAKAGLPSSESLFEMEEHAGGLVGTVLDRDPRARLERAQARVSQEAGDWCELLIGPGALLKRHVEIDARVSGGLRLVPVAFVAPLAMVAGLDGDLVYYHDRTWPVSRIEIYAMDERGRIWRKAHRAATVDLFASSYRTFVAKLAVLCEIATSKPLVLRMRPRVGRRVADFLRASAVEEASDEVHSFWRADGLVVEDGDCFETDASSTTAFATRADPLAVLARIEELRASLAFERVPTSYFPPSGAPEFPREMVQSASCITLGFDSTEDEGVVAVVSDCGDARVHQVRTMRGRVASWRIGGQKSDNFMLATERLANRVSARCLRWLAARDITHDEQTMLGRAALSRALVERGFPAHASVFDFEEGAGGLWMPQGDGRVTSLGVSIQLRGPVRPRGGLVPCGAIPAASGRYWVDEQGHVTFDDGVEQEVVAGSWRVLLERMAICHDYPHVSGRLWPLSLEICDDIAGEIASRLGAPPSAELSDEFESYWENDDVLIWKPSEVVTQTPCIVRSHRVREIVRAMRAARAASASARMRVGGRSLDGSAQTHAPERGEVRFPFGSPHEKAAGEILVRGDDWIEQRIQGQAPRIFADR